MAPTAPTLLAYGETALLIESEADQVPAVLAALTAAGLSGVAEVVPAARTVLLRVTSPAALEPVRAEVGALLAAPLPAAPPPSDERTTVIEVVYDGPDLSEVASLLALTPDEVVAAHTASPWRVAFCGVAPGFAYLAGGDPRLRVPRRGSARQLVPAGAVGLAGEYSGVYPRPAPGRWQLIGRTAAAVWEPTRTPPALLIPGNWARFVAVGS